MASPKNNVQLAKNYDPSAIEQKWYNWWMEQGLFHSRPDERKAYTIVMPPPNVTGVLHMGHMLNNTIQDILIRRARMKGFNACWVPGTDHASIATEAKVVQLLREQGTSKGVLGREKFLEQAWAWKEKYGGIILDQLKKLGASCDWDRTRFTMEDELSRAVEEVFVDLYQKGYIYRGYRMVNWDPAGLTALSDEEVIHKEEQSVLYHVRYPLEGGKEYMSIATTRPETIPADTALCVHPGDERYKKYLGKRVQIPVTGRWIPVIADEYVDPEFGTGCLKVTPAHDQNDYDIGQRHGLEVIDILTPDGKINELGGVLQGMDRFEARKHFAALLKKEGFLIKEEAIVNKVGYSERTNAIIEPRLSMQWFCRMKELAAPALTAVENGEVALIPPKFVNTYRHWMQNIRDWCISRQLWWGHRIPAWYYGEGKVVVARTAAEALERARTESGNARLSMKDLRQDEDVLDTWFSSWLWPISVFDGFKDPDNKDIRYYYPTQDLVTAPEILFFWVARMIISGYEYRKERPFERVYLTGIVRDKQGRKMSKSLGNSPDCLELIDKYGADAVRVGMMLCSPAGNDLLFDESLLGQGRNFANKIWNAFRLMEGWETGRVDEETLKRHAVACSWMAMELSEQLAALEKDFLEYRISEALMRCYKLTWDTFCSQFLEMIKPQGSRVVPEETLTSARNLFSALLRMLHPFMPFITEELWKGSGFDQDRAETSIMMAAWPDQADLDQEVKKWGAIWKDLDGKELDAQTLGRKMQAILEALSQIRTLRTKENLGRNPISAAWKSHINALFPASLLLEYLGGLETGTTVQDGQRVPVMVGTQELELFLKRNVDPETEKKQLMEEIQYLEGFLGSVEKKLQNERFVNGAPKEVVDREKQKQADAQAKLELLRSRLA